MNEFDDEFEQDLRRGLGRLADRGVAENLDNKVMQRLRRRIIRRRLTTAGVVAAILAAGFFMFLKPNHGPSPAHENMVQTPLPAVSPAREEPMTLAEVEQTVIRSGLAAQTLAAAQDLAQLPAGQPIARQRLKDVIERFPETDSAVLAKSQLHSLTTRRTIQ